MSCYNKDKNKNQDIFILTYKIRIKNNFISNICKDKLVKDSIRNSNSKMNKTRYNKYYSNYIGRNCKYKNNDNNCKYEWQLLRRSIRRSMNVTRKIANHCVDNKKSKISSKDVKNFGKLPSTIANAIINKYKNNKSIKKVTRRVNLIINMNKDNEAIKYNKSSNILTITPFKPFSRFNIAPQRLKDIIGNSDYVWDKFQKNSLKFNWKCPDNVIKINQVELNTDYCYITVSVIKDDLVKKNRTIGVDMNLKPTIAVLGTSFDKESFPHRFYGYGMLKTRAKFLRMRARYQRQAKPMKLSIKMKRKAPKVRNKKKAVWIPKKDLEFQRPGRVRRVKNKESRIIRDVNHKISNSIVKISDEYNTNIAMENLTGLREAKINKKNRHWLQVFPFYSLQQMIEYKGIIKGTVVVYINPYGTSQECNKCHRWTKCNSKSFKCKYTNCSNKNHRDINAGDNIGDRGQRCLDICL